ncbi:MAG: TlpA family protein disulfide reductase [Proteobacteria bacterium]|nr:TlpA family protein disulfide reductase [Pseudomonadota bacterium]
MSRLAATILLMLLTAVPAWSAELPLGIRAMPGQAATDFTLTDLDGKKHTLSAYRGRWVFVHFWASWCGPCRAEMPKVEAIAEDAAKAGLVLLLVNTAESEDEAFSFMGGVAPSLNTTLDKDGTVTEVWQPRGLPATFFVDPKGKIRYQALGGRPWADPAYRQFLKSLK